MEKDVKEKMTKGETIAYAINKECGKWSLKEWCKTWGIAVEEFKKFLEIGSAAYDGMLEILEKKRATQGAERREE